MKVIAVLSRKGGCGKTLISHLLSSGVGSLGEPCVLVQTDVRSSTPPHDVKGRPYLAFGIDSRETSPEEKFLDIYTKCERFGDIVMVIDGGANRRNVDLVATSIADLVIVPCGYSTEDTEVALNDLAEFRSNLAQQNRPDVPVALLLNRWPGDVRRQRLVMSRPWVQEFLASTQTSRLDDPIPDLTSAIDMTFNGSPSAPIGVRMHGVRLAKRVLTMLGVPFHDASDQSSAAAA